MLAHLYSQLEKQFPILSRAKFIFFVGLTDFQRADLFRQASAMAYVTLLSIVPSLAAVFSLISFFKPVLGKDGQLMAYVKEFIVSNLAQGTGDQVAITLSNFVEDLNFAKIGVTSFAGLLIALILLLRQIEGALNRIWKVKNARNVITRFIYFWTFLTLGSFLLSMAFGLSTGFNISQFLDFGATGVSGVSKGWFYKLIVGASTGSIFFFFLYKIVPNRTVNNLPAFIGAIVASGMFQVASKGFGLYVKDFSGHKALYGALAALPLFLMWLYICWIIILLGGLVAWRFQEGLPEMKSETKLEISEAPMDKLQDYRVKAMLPVSILYLIYHDFSGGNGRGFPGEKLYSIFKLPSDWLSEALGVLIDQGYVLPKIELEGEFSTSDFDQASFFPCQPAESLLVEKITQDIFTKPSDWPLLLETRVSQDVMEFLKRAQKGDAKSPLSKYLA